MIKMTTVQRKICRLGHRPAKRKTSSTSPAGKPGLGKPVFRQGAKSATGGGGSAEGDTGEETGNSKLAVTTEFMRIET